MGGGKAPEDKSDRVAEINAQAAREAREAAAREEARKQAQFDASLNAAFGSGISSAEDFFLQRGLDPADYMSTIQTKANQVRSSIPNLAGDPGSYFSNLGQIIFDQLTGAEQAKNQKAINTIAPQGFATNRIQDTADDEIIAAILEERRGEADNYLQNLLNRGVITNSGMAAAQRNLENQGLTAKATLSDLGMGILETGRAGAENKANDYRSRAAQSELGSGFDPYGLGNELNDYFASFFNGLGDKVRVAAPTNLFDTSGLASLAGAAQGAGNTKFDPRAVAGIIDEDDDDNIFGTSTNPF